MMLPSLGTASTIPLSLPPTTRLLWAEFHREQRNFFHLTELEVRTTFMFRRRYKRWVKNPATNWSVWYKFVKLMGDGVATLP